MWKVAGPLVVGNPAPPELPAMTTLLNDRMRWHLEKLWRSREQHVIDDLGTRRIDLRDEHTIRPALLLDTSLALPETRRWSGPSHIDVAVIDGERAKVIPSPPTMVVERFCFPSGQLGDDDAAIDSALNQIDIPGRIVAHFDDRRVVRGISNGKRRRSISRCVGRRSTRAARGTELPHSTVNHETRSMLAVRPSTSLAPLRAFA